MDNTQILALDFDGVIADSIDECLVTAHNGYGKYRQQGDRRQDLRLFSDTEIHTFRGLRPLIRRGEDYVFLLQAMEEGLQLSSQEQFDDFLNRNESRRDEYRELFYAERERLQNLEPQKWLELNPLYPGMASFLAALDPNTVYIVTTKDLRSIQLILEHNQVHLHPENMFQADRDFRKPAILNAIQETNSFEPAQIHFIDDHVATALEVKHDTEVTVYCAKWGYNTEDQLETLKAVDIPTVSLDQFMAHFGEY